LTLNIKDAEAYRLARAIAESTGQTLTRVVTEALRDRYALLESQRGKSSVEELLAIADRCAVHIRGPYLDHSDYLFDERGLPK
jgi:antitoxin VapB